MAVEETRSTWVDLIRHGQPEGGQRYRGHRDDPLSHVGWEQMRAAVEPRDHWDVVITSPLLRCRAFAQAIADERGIPLHVEPDFKEISFGRWEGMKAEEILARDGDRLAAFWSDGEANPPPGGEALSAFHGRVARGWHHWVHALWGQRILVVAHGGVIRMMLACVLDVPPGRLMAGLHVPYACRSRVRMDRTDHGLLSCLMAHGEGPP
ncbi:histidine phosphatase family protein [Aquisalimonas asiatica]|uniref:Alpha-ribazole phosphatase n=1 Tax=Aquisalimonas asiatica TaxID=406100 RepID=A0A1H8UEU6_9GAMM|nr:histidine phosphatase family protein [Aquisalimonas asiatica]SEP01725.1 alpha-ribazole phosphatase [Aquisalimonas asiatica]